MNSPLYSQLLHQFSGKHASLLKKTLHGLEKENLRVDPRGQLSKKGHPQALGSALNHPHISLDFANAQLEFITQPFAHIEHALEQLTDIHHYVYQQLGSELLWPSSMPCEILNEQEVDLAQFGLTQEAYEKELYREGLARRYGKKMQLLSGIHYSFSLQDPFFEHLKTVYKSKESLEDFRSKMYLALSRNFLRWGWLISYLFGASPLGDQSTFTKSDPHLKKMGLSTFIAPDATSLRMSHLGYFSKIQSQRVISLNSLDAYRRDLKKALTTSHPCFEKIGVMENGKQIQMNTNVLQIEAEHYSRIRPKPFSHISKRPLEALEEGVGYFEVRNIDINPLIPLGLDLDMLYFMHLFFIFCLFKKSPPILTGEAKIICHNQNQVALLGRSPSLKLVQKKGASLVSLKKWAGEIIHEMKELALLLDGTGKPLYQKSLKRQLAKVDDVMKTPSAQLIQDFNKEKLDYQQFILKKGEKFKKYFMQTSLSSSKKTAFEKLAKISLAQTETQELKEEDQLAGYREMEPSTQMVIQEAFKRGYRVDILDRKDNFIRIHGASNSMMIKQATQTARDTFVSYWAMENKFVTQTLLREHGLTAPKGRLFESSLDALEKYSFFQKEHVVVKPNCGNYGEGISFVEPQDKKTFRKAVLEIEKRGDQILVEPFFKGKEYRFLVIGSKVVAIAHRVPPYVVGDGQHSILQLIKLKNQKNEHRRRFQKPLEVKGTVVNTLNKQGLNAKSVLKKNQQVFLRHNSNVSTGGESWDATEKVHGGYSQIALSAAQACGAKICGVDMMIQEIKSKPSDLNHLIIETNHNPALFIHRFPARGKKRYVEKDLLNFLFE